MADSQWILDIAANMPDGAATIAELDELTAKLTGATRKSDEFQGALKRVTSDLDAAKAASSQAAAALAVGADQYKVLEREAVRAAKALDTAQSKGRIDMAAARAAHEAQVALEAYTGTLKGLEDASAAAQGKQDKLARSLANLNKLGAHADARNAALSQRYEKLGAAVSRLPGPLGMIGGRFVGAAKSAHEVQVALGATNAAALALAAGAAIAVLGVAALTAALVAGAIASVKYAVAQADAARSARLSRDAFAALSAETAAGVASFDAISAATGLADADLVKLTKQLRDAKVSAADMPAALRAAALAERALGTGGSSEFVDRLREGELAVGAFAAEVEGKFGGIVADQLRGLDAQTSRASKAWSKLFAGVNVEPFLDALGVLVGMFEKGHPLAAAFGGAVEGAINPIGPMALKAAYAVEAFALGFAIQLTKMYIAVKPAIKWLREFFGLSSEGDALYETMAKVGEVVAVVAVALGVGLAGAMAAVGAAFAAAAGLLALFAYGAYNVVNAVWTVWSSLISVGVAIVDWATTVGVDLMMGLVNGITSAVTAVVDAVRNAVGLAIDTAKSVLGIASPSKVFAEIGTDTVAGFTESVDAGALEAQGSMAALVAPDPVTSSSAGSAGASGASIAGASKAFDFSGAVFNFHGVKDAETARDMFSEMLTRLFEDDADSLGGAEVPA
jgi:hypothetical protein